MTVTATPLITVYTRPDCVQCTYTKRELDKRGVAYTEIDIGEPLPAAAEGTVADWLREQGFTSAPVVINHATGERWSGFKREKLRDLAVA